MQHPSHGLFRLLAVAMLAIVFSTEAAAQTDSTKPALLSNGRKAITVADYSRWRSIEGAVIAPDGRWVAYTLRYANTLPAESKPVLRIRNLQTDQDVEIANAHSARLSDSRWIVYQVDSVPAPRSGRGPGAGAPPDSSSDFSQSWGWSYQVTGGSGANGNQYYLNGQGRWGRSPWDDPNLYRFESALAHAPSAHAPFLIMHGTADPTVSFSEGMNFYNALRFNGKSAVMLAYPGEGHGLRGLANRRDLTIRYFQFFDHYLKGEPAPKWMTDGVPFLVKEVLRGDPK